MFGPGPKDRLVQDAVHVGARARPRPRLAIPTPGRGGRPGRPDTPTAPFDDDAVGGSLNSHEPRAQVETRRDGGRRVGLAGQTRVVSALAQVVDQLGLEFIEGKLRGRHESTGGRGERTQGNADQGHFRRGCSSSSGSSSSRGTPRNRQDWTETAQGHPATHQGGCTGNPPQQGLQHFGVDTHKHHHGFVHRVVVDRAVGSHTTAVVCC